MTLSDAFKKMIKQYHEGLEPEEINKVKPMKYNKKYFDKVAKEFDLDKDEH